MLHCATLCMCRTFSKPSVKRKVQEERLRLPAVEPTLPRLHSRLPPAQFSPARRLLLQLHCLITRHHTTPPLPRSPPSTRRLLRKASQVPPLREKHALSRELRASEANRRLPVGGGVYDAARRRSIVNEMQSAVQATLQ